MKHTRKEESDLSTLESVNDAEAKRREAQPEAIRDFEAACNTIALVFGHNSEQRRIAITARGDMREANGEPRT
jgi:hypothetical protein